MFGSVLPAWVSELFRCIAHHMHMISDAYDGTTPAGQTCNTNTAHFTGLKDRYSCPILEHKNTRPWYFDFQVVSTVNPKLAVFRKAAPILAAGTGVLTLVGPTPLLLMLLF
jgi:hypothetical protein